MKCLVRAVCVAGSLLMDGIVHLILLQVLAAPLVSFDPTNARMERVTFSVTIGGDVPSKGPSSRMLATAATPPLDVGPLPSKALLAAMEACGAGGLADEILELEHRGIKIVVNADVPEGAPTSGRAVLRAVGTDMSCFTPELQKELQHFVVLTDRPTISYGKKFMPPPVPLPPPPSPSPPPPLPSPPPPLPSLPPKPPSPSPPAILNQPWTPLWLGMVFWIGLVLCAATWQQLPPTVKEQLEQRFDSMTRSYQTLSDSPPDNAKKEVKKATSPASRTKGRTKDGSPPSRSVAAADVRLSAALPSANEIRAASPTASPTKSVASKETSAAPAIAGSPSVAIPASPTTDSPLGGEVAMATWMESSPKQSVATAPSVAAAPSVAVTTSTPPKRLSPSSSPMRNPTPRSRYEQKLKFSPHADTAAASPSLISLQQTIRDQERALREFMERAVHAKR